MPPKQPDKIFAYLFSLFKQRAGLLTLESFCDALADEGVILDSSTFSHWQRGTRTPHKRPLLLRVLRVLVKHQGIKSVYQANALLSAADQGHLSPEEKKWVFNPELQLINHIQPLCHTQVVTPTPEESPPEELFNTTFNLLLPIKMYRYLERVAQQRGVSKASFIRELIENEMALSTTSKI